MNFCPDLFYSISIQAQDYLTQEQKNQEIIGQFDDIQIVVVQMAQWLPIVAIRSKPCRLTFIQMIFD